MSKEEKDYKPEPRFTVRPAAGLRDKHDESDVLDRMRLAAAPNCIRCGHSKETHLHLATGRARACHGITHESSKYQEDFEQECDCPQYVALKQKEE